MWLGNGARLIGDDGPNASLNQYRLYHRVPHEIQGPERIRGILVICPGLNGSGEVACQEGSPWAEFADRQRLLLVSPTFYCDPGKVHDRRVCYYYPESGSFDWLLNEIAKLADRHGISDRKLLLFGFSAGAHVVHRLALWKPDRVKAVVAQGAGWWENPRTVGQRAPMLVLCGEQDDRYYVSLEFYRAAMRAGYPMVWRSYPGLGHEVDDRVIKLAQAFFKAYGEDLKDESEWIGDIQEWQAYPTESEASESIPLEYRTILPSAMMVKVWKEMGSVP